MSVRESLRELARDKFMEYRANGVTLTANQIVNRSKEWFGQKIPLGTIRDWMIRDQWHGNLVELLQSTQVLRYQELLEDAIDECDNAHVPATMAHMSRALVTLMNTVPRELNLAYRDRIECIAGKIHATIHDGVLGIVIPTVFASLITTYTKLTSFIAAEEIVDQDGIDADAVLMGLEDAETDN